MTPIDPDTLMLMGRVYRAHGIRGEVKVVPETDEPERFLSLETVFTGPDVAHLTPHVLASVRFQHSKRGVTVIARFEDVNDRDTADRFRKHYVFAREGDLDVAEGDVFIDDLLGVEVRTEAGAFVGTVREVMETPAQHVFVVERLNASDVLIPNVPEIVIDIDEEGGTLIIAPIEGLLE